MTQEAIQAIGAAIVLVLTYSAPWTIGAEYMVPVLGIGGALLVTYSALARHIHN